MKQSNICKTCVLPDSPSFPLDQNGICPLCKSQSAFWETTARPDQEGLQNILREVKSRGESREYDCMVAWSGGRDSTHMLRELLTRHGLRCIAVFGRTPFTPTEIIENVHRIADLLKVELIEIRSSENHLDIARFCINEWLKDPHPILINLACASCKRVNRGIFREASRRGIRTVIYGGNPFEYLRSGPASIDIDSMDRYSFTTMIRDNLLRIGKGMRTVATSPVLLRHIGTLACGSLLYVNQYTPYLRLRYPGIRRFDYYHFADWDESHVQTALDDMGWQLPPGCTSTWRADCLFEAVKNAAFQQQLGFTYSHALYSNLIRAEKMSRDEGLDRLAKEGVSETRLNAALELLGISRDQFIHRDYE